MGLKMSLWKGKIMKKNEGVITKMVRCYKCQWILLENFSQILGFISFRGRPVKCLTIAMVVERDICVLEFDPLSQWEPIELKELVLV